MTQAKVRASRWTESFKEAVQEKSGIRKINQKRSLNPQQKQNKVTAISRKFVLNPHHTFEPSWKSNACIELTERRNWRSSRRRGG